MKRGASSVGLASARGSGSRGAPARQLFLVGVLALATGAMTACDDGDGVDHRDPPGPVVPPECEVGSTYYVDPDEGDDANSGLDPDDAWRTLERPNLHTFGPGECLLFRRGSTSLGQLTLDHLDSGEAGRPLTLDTYDRGESPSASARPGSPSPWGVEPASGAPWGTEPGAPGTPWAPAPGASCDEDALATIHQTATGVGELTGHGVVLHSAQHVTLRNLHLVGPGVQNDREDGGAEECVAHGGCGLLVYTDGSHGRRSGIEARCVVAEGWDRAGFQVASTSPAKIGYSNVLFEDCAALGNGKAGFTTNGLFSPEATLYAHADIRISHSVAHGNPGRSFDTTTHSGNGIVLSDVDGASVRYSRAYANGASSNWQGGGPVGIWAWDATDVALVGNWSYDNRSGLTGKDGGGFDLDGGVTRSRMVENHSWGNDGSGFMIYHFAGARGETAGNEVTGNQSTDDARTNGAALLLGGWGDDVAARVHTNTFADNIVAGSYGPAVDLTDALGNGNAFLRNDFSGATGAPTLRSELDLSTARVLFRENAYPPGFTAEWGDTSYPSLDSWRAGTGQEPGG